MENVQNLSVLKVGQQKQSHVSHQGRFRKMSGAMREKEKGNYVGLKGVEKEN